MWPGIKGWSMWWRGVARHKGVEHVVEGCGQAESGRSMWCGCG